MDSDPTPETWGDYFLRHFRSFLWKCIDFWEFFTGWLQSDRRHQIITVLSLIAGFFATSTGWLYFFPDTQTQTATQSVLEKTEPVVVTVQPGDDLGSIGKKFDRSRIEMIGFNLELLQENTKKCNRLGLKSGVCRRDNFGELKNFAFDAIFPEDQVRVFPKSKDLTLAQNK